MGQRFDRVLYPDTVKLAIARRLRRDPTRTAFFEARGYQVVRVPNREVSRARLECLLRQFMGDGSCPLSR